jgi:hypothetical protein
MTLRVWASRGRAPGLGCRIYYHVGNWVVMVNGGQRKGRWTTGGKGSAAELGTPKEEAPDLGCGWLEVTQRW